MVNRERQAHGKGRVDLDTRLLAAAQSHSNAMAAAGVLSHQVRGEQPLATRVMQAGYAFAAARENIGEEDTALAVVQKWMDESGHRMNLLSESTHIGFGLTINWSGTHYWTAVLASPMNATNTPEASDGEGSQTS